MFGCLTQDLGAPWRPLPCLTLAPGPNVPIQPRFFGGSSGHVANATPKRPQSDHGATRVEAKATTKLTRSGPRTTPKRPGLKGEHEAAPSPPERNPDTTPSRHPIDAPAASGRAHSSHVAGGSFEPSHESSPSRLRHGRASISAREPTTRVLTCSLSAKGARDGRHAAGRGQAPPALPCQERQTRRGSDEVTHSESTGG